MKIDTSKVIRRLELIRDSNYIKKSFDIRSLSDKDILDVVIIGFNNSEVIKVNIDLLKKNLKCNFCISVLDNSNRRKFRKKIKDVAEKEKVNYISLPYNYRKQPSYSHGLALNWAYYNYLKKRNANYFAFLDQDIFLSSPKDVVSVLKNHQLYGIKHDAEQGWYIWPGLLFARRELFLNKKIDFLPLEGFGDTGSRIWEEVYKYCDYSSLQLLSIDDGKSYISEDNNRANMVWKFEEWIHMGNSSLWCKEADLEKKSKIVDGILKNE